MSRLAVLSDAERGYRGNQRLLPGQLALQLPEAVEGWLHARAGRILEREKRVASLLAWRQCCYGSGLGGNDTVLDGRGKGRN